MIENNKFLKRTILILLLFVMLVGIFGPVIVLAGKDVDEEGGEKVEDIELLIDLGDRYMEGGLEEDKEIKTDMEDPEDGGETVKYIVKFKEDGIYKEETKRSKTGKENKNIKSLRDILEDPDTIVMDKKDIIVKFRGYGNLAEKEDEGKDNNKELISILDYMKSNDKIEKGYKLKGWEKFNLDAGKSNKEININEIKREEQGEEGELLDPGILDLKISKILMKKIENTDKVEYLDTEKKAKYGRKKFQVEFETSGGSNINEIIVEEGKKIRKPENPTKEGYEFDGWYKDIEYKNKWNFEEYKLVEDITLYAKWKKKDDGGGGSAG